MTNRTGILWSARALLVTLMLIVALIAAQTTRGPGTHTLSGNWPADVNGAAQPGGLHIPLNFRAAGLAPGDEVRWLIPMQLTDPTQSLAVLIEQPHGALSVSWDGVPTSANDGAGGPLLTVIPPAMAAPGSHSLEVELRGDTAGGSLTGPIRYGTESAIRGRHSRHQTHLWILVALLLFAAGTCWAAAGRRPASQGPLWFGLFCFGLAAVAGTYTTGWSDVAFLRPRRVAFRHLAQGASSAAALLLVIRLNEARLSRPLMVLTGVTGAVSIIVGVWPGSLSVMGFDMLLDILSTAIAATCVAILATRRNSKFRYRIAMLLSTIAFAATGGSMVAASWGVYASTALLIPGAMLVVAVTAAALIARASDRAGRYDRMVAQARDAILVCDPSGVFIESNPAALALLGDAPGLLACAQEGDADLCRTHLRPGAQGRRIEWRMVGTAPRTLESVAVDLPGGTILLVLRDITTRRELEAGLLRSARMETVGLLASGLAHDFNNTLSALMTHVGILRLRSESVESDRLDRMEGIIRGAAQITRRLLTLVRGETLAHTNIEIQSLLDGVATLARPLMPPNVRIEIEHAPGLPPLHGDAADIEHALLNLLVNARDAAPGESQTIRMAAGVADGRVVLSVTDEGPGVPEQLQTHIWEAFFTTKGAGTGLGLAVVQRVARRHAGSAHLISTRAGARFELRLPPGHPSESPTESLPRAWRVGVLSGDQRWATATRDELRSRGFLAEGYPSAGTALAASPSMDLMLVDERRQTDLEVLRNVSQSSCRPRILIVSSRDDEDPATLSVQSSAEEMTASVRRALLHGV